MALKVKAKEQYQNIGKYAGKSSMLVSIVT